MDVVITDGPAPDADTIASCREVHREYGDNHGVIVFRRGTPRLIEYTGSLEYRDNTLVPFYAYYESTTMIVRV